MANEDFDQEDELLERATIALRDAPIPPGPPDLVLGRVLELPRHRWLRNAVGPAFVHPMVRRAAAGVAAVLMLGAVGYVGGTAIHRGALPQPGDHLFASAQRFITGGDVRQTQQNQSQVTVAESLHAEPAAATPSVTVIDSSDSMHVRSPNDMALRAIMISRNPENAAEANWDERSNDAADLAKWTGKPNALPGYAIENHRLSGVKRGQTGEPVKEGSGTLVMGGANTFNGLTIDGGTVGVAADGNLGSASGSITFKNDRSSTLLDTGSFSDSRGSVTLNGTGGTINVSSGQTVTLTGAIGGAGGLFKGSNSGTLVLTNGNSYGGTTTVSAGGTVQNGTDNALPNTTTQEIKSEANAYAARLTVQEARAPVTVADASAPVAAPTAAPQPAPAVAMAKIIRNGDIEFEVDNFDSAYDRIARIAAEEGGAISSTESEKLANGKTRGTIVVRVIPDNLDRLVLKLRSLGELKSQHISAQDVTKQYTDVESQLRAARAMEERLLDMIKNTKGNVKDLLAAEKELANWRGFIEQYEGQLRYYNNLIALSTLNITLYEKDMATPSAAVDAETISMGVETQDVAKSRTAALAAIDEVQGRVIVSQLKQYEAGQLAAVIVAEVPPEAAGPLTDRLRMLGNVSRLDIDRKQTTQGNVVLAALKVDRQPTRLELSLYNLADVAPRQTTVVSLACADVETAYRAILAAADVPDQPAGAAGGGLPAVRIVSSSLNTQNPQFTSAAVSLEARGDRAAAIEKLIRGAGEVMKLTLSENPDTANVTRSKQGFSVTLTPLAQVTPRESRTLQVAANDVSGVYYRLLAFLQASPPANTPADSDDGGPARVLSAQLSGDASAGIGAALSFEIPRSREIGLEAALAGRSDSDVLTRSVARASGDTDTVDSKIRYDVSLIDAAKVPPRQTTTMAIEVGDVEQALGAATQAAVKSGGSALDPRWARDQAGASSASVSLDVPVAAAGAVQDALERLGTVRVVQSVRAPQVPDGTLARARFELTLGNAQQLIEPGEGVDSHFREGLRTSVSGLLWSFQWIVIGLLLIGPWAVLAWIARKLWRRARQVRV